MNYDDDKKLENVTPYRATGNFNTTNSIPLTNNQNTMNQNSVNMQNQYNNIYETNSQNTTNNQNVNNTNVKKTYVTTDNKPKKKKFNLNLTKEFKIALLIIVILFVFVLRILFITFLETPTLGGSTIIVSIFLNFSIPIGLISPLQVFSLSPGLISRCLEYKQNGQ